MSAVLQGVPDSVSPEQEAALVQRVDKEELILVNLKEAFFYGKGCYQSRGMVDGEILSAAYDGLRAAARTFRPGGLRFFSFAKPHIRGALIKVTRAKYVVKKTPDVEQLPDPEEGVGDEQSDDIVVETKTWKGEFTLPRLREFFVKDEYDQLAPLLRTVLNDRQRMIIELHFQGGLNLQEIAELIGYSRAYVHGAKQTALKKIRNRLIERHQYFNRR